MIQAASARLDREHRRHIEDVLASHRLAGVKRSSIVADEEPWGQRFAAAVSELSGGFAFFGHFLGTRPDIVGLTNALDLEAWDLRTVDFSALDHWGPNWPLPGLGPEQRIHEILQRPALSIFSEIDPVPIADSLLYQEFRGRLRHRAAQEGDPVVIRLRRQGIEGSLDQDLSLLSALRPAFTRSAGFTLDLHRRRFEAVLEQHRNEIRAQLDLQQSAQSLRHFADDLVDDDLLTVPKIFNDLCSPSMTVRQWLIESTLEDAKSTGTDSQGRSVQTRELGRRLNLGCLEQALVAGHIPVDTEWRVLREGRLAVVGGRFERLAAASRPRLWAYLRHLAGHRPEQAFDAIAGELTPIHSGAKLDAMKLRMRQLVPFRDGGWTERRDTVAELIALHWCLAAEQGFEPSPALASLWSCLYQTAGHDRKLEVDGDSLRAALDDLRWLASFRRMRRLSEPQELGNAFEDNIASLMDMPQKVDRLLQLVSGEAGDDLQLRLRVTGDSDLERRRNALNTTLCLAALMVAVVFVGERLPSLGVPLAWVETTSAFLFLALGAWLLMTLTRQK